MMELEEEQSGNDGEGTGFRDVGDLLERQRRQMEKAKAVVFTGVSQAAGANRGPGENGYRKLSYMRKREIAARLSGAKKDGTRKSRIAKIVQESRGR